MLESEGIPAVVIGTDEFAELVRLEAEQRGLPDLHRLAIPHPIGGIKPPVVIEKAQPTVSELIAHFTDQTGRRP